MAPPVLDGLTLVLWKEGKWLIWDGTVVCPLADSYYVDASAREAGSAAKAAAVRKTAKYTRPWTECRPTLFNPDISRKI